MPITDGHAIACPPDPRRPGRAFLLADAAGVVGTPLPELFSAPNPTGLAQTIATAPATTDNPFFTDLGTNGRTCATCHTPMDGWTITPPKVQALFKATQGLDPLFRTNDGSTRRSPTSRRSPRDKRRSACS